MPQDKNYLKKYIDTINEHFKSEVVTYHNETRKPNSIPSITGKIEGGIDGIASVMRNVFGKNVSIEPLYGDIADRISGKYDSFNVILNNNSSFYFRSIVGSSGALTDKDLTPNKLSLNGKTINKNNIIDEVIVGLLNNNQIPMNILELCHALAIEAKNKGNIIHFQKQSTDLFNSITISDSKKIGKNYGEIILAIWCLYNKPNATSIFFPNEENNKLADFVVNFTKQSNKAPLNISAKFENGANASINSIIPKNMLPPESATSDEKNAYNALSAVTHDKIIDGLLNAQKILLTPEYNILKNMIGVNTLTLLNISNFIEDILLKNKITKNIKPSKLQYDNFIKDLQPFYDCIPGPGKGIPDIKSLEKISNLSNGKHYHPILYAFSVSLADKFNNDPIFSDILNKAANSIKAEQLYIVISNNSMQIKVKEFEKSKFLFKPGAMTYSADNVRMKFQMLK